MSATVGSCLSCEGRCCTEYIVPLTGDDVWRIVQAQRLAPILFVQREPETRASSAGFLLRPGNATFTMALRHQYARRDERPCIFLMHLRDGVQRCGIYAHRPIACQTYPMRLQPNGVVPRDDMLCPRGSWLGITQNPGQWRERLIRQDWEWERYERVVEAWNLALRQRPADTGFVLEQYLAFVLAAYDQFNALGMPPTATSQLEAMLNPLAEAWTAQNL